MKILKITTVLFFATVLAVLSFKTPLYAASEDFLIESYTKIIYETGKDYVTVENEYIRSVKNSKYYFPATGEKLFHIPDLQGDSQERINTERAYKKQNLTVLNEAGSAVKYSVQEKENGQGIYISVPNYKQTTSSSPYRLKLSYTTHDYLKKVEDLIVLVGTSLPTDTQFSVVDKDSNTTTTYNYHMSIITDKNIAPLAKIFPDYVKEEKGSETIYKFLQTDRLESAPYLEFGTSVLYRFEMNYKTPKTDNFIPEKYSNILKAISANIYEISLPREFAETSQRVYFEKVSPSPIDIYKDEEGNVIAVFEMPANKEGIISIEGYITAEQNSYNERVNPLDIKLDEYIQKIQASDFTKKYLTPTKYWESGNQYIVDIANNLKKDVLSLEDIVHLDYKYVNDILDYDESKANSDNERIGAVKALQGGGSVCMEYADSMIAILRAQGIPARAALGYANLDENRDGNQIRHQWVQIWIPEYGWYSIDPTFESKNMKLGQQLDRVLWETFNGDSLSNIRIFSADNIQEMTTNGFSLKVFGVSDKIDVSNLKGYVDLVPNKEYDENGLPENKSFVFSTWINTFLKATVLGRALVITIPVIVTLAVLISIISILSSVIKRNRKKI